MQSCYNYFTLKNQTDGSWDKYKIYINLIQSTLCKFVIVFIVIILVFWNLQLHRKHPPVVHCSVTTSCLTLWPCGLQHTRFPCPSPSPGVYSNSYPLSWWCHPTISSSVNPFSSLNILLKAAILFKDIHIYTYMQIYIPTYIYTHI